MTASGADPGRARYHHGDLRASLIRAAGEQLEAHGAAALSLREVAKASGVSHAAPYRHFRDKAALLEAIAQGGFAALEGAVHEAVRRHPGHPLHQLIESGRAYVEEAVARPQRAQLMFGGQLERAHCSPSLIEAMDRAFQALVEVVRTGQQAGVFRPAPTRDLALSIWSAVHGLTSLLLAGQLDTLLRPGDTPASLNRIVCEQMLRGLAADTDA